MIRNNLAALMGERGLKITRVAKETGISRNTITSISQNDSDMIRMETVNTLCKYLGVTPCDFYLYEPVDIEFSVFFNKINCFFSSDFPSNEIIFKSIDGDIIVDVIGQNQKKSFDLRISLINSNAKLGDFSGGVTLNLNVEFEDTEEKEYFIEYFYKKINPAFHQDIYNSLLSEVRKLLLEYVNNEEITDTRFSIDQKSTFQSILKQNLSIEVTSDVFKRF